MAMRIERELMRGAGPLAILQLLARRAMYGYELIEALTKAGDGALNMGHSTLYPMLYNLEAKKLIRGTWEKADSGRDRKYYSLTLKGKKHLASTEQQWKALLKAFRQLNILNLGVKER
jgi:PadR family transcriptional regulator